MTNHQLHVAESREDSSAEETEEMPTVESRELPSSTGSDLVDNSESSELAISPVPEVSPENFDKEGHLN
jgi:hypothetical protein